VMPVQEMHRWGIVDISLGAVGVWAKHEGGLKTGRDFSAQRQLPL